MAERRLIIGVGDSNCAGAVAASSLSSAPLVTPPPSSFNHVWSEQPQLKIWDYKFGQQNWEDYSVSAGNTHWESEVAGPEFTLRWTASGMWGRRFGKEGGGLPINIPPASASMFSSTDLYLFKGSKYQTGLLKWDNSLDNYGNVVPLPDGVNYTSFWPGTKDENLWAATGIASSYGFANQLSAAVSDLQDGGNNEVIVDGIYVVLGTLDALAPYGSTAFRYLLVEYVTQIYGILEDLGCTLNNLHPQRNLPVTILVGIHDQYDHGGRTEEENRFNSVRSETYEAAIDLNTLGKTEAYFLPTAGSGSIYADNLTWNYYTSSWEGATSANNVVYSVASDKVHYDLSGIYNLGATISDVIYPLSTLNPPSPTVRTQTATQQDSPTPTAPGSTFASPEGVTDGKVGLPKVKSYGSSYGIYQGNRLGDYKTPRPDDLNDKDAKDVVEFKDFDRTIKDYVLSKLGYPVVDVELEDFQLNVCIDEAISKLEFHAPDWMTQYATFEVTGGVNVYELPSVIADNLNDVWYKRDFFKFGASPGSLEYDFAIMFFTNTGLFNNYNVSQYLLMQQYLKQVKNVLGQMSTWQLINNKHLHLFPIPESSGDTVILEFRAFDPKTIHHAYKSWLQRYTLCIAKEILGGIRGKYQTLPGPGGGTKLNGEALMREAAEEKEKLMEELMTEIEGPPLFDIV